MQVQSFWAWIHAVNTLLFLVGKSGLGGFGMVFSKPLISLEHKTFRIGPAANVDLDLYLSAAEDDSVIPYQHVTTRIKALRSGLLKDSKNPLFRIQDRVPNKLRAIDAYKGCSAGTTLDRIVTHHDASGFVFGTGRAEEAQIGRTSDVHRTLASLDEMTFLDRDVGATSFRLNASRCRKVWLTNEPTA